MKGAFPIKDSLFIQYHLHLLTKTTSKQSRCEWQAD
jgi:hypothetical protein